MFAMLGTISLPAPRSRLISAATDAASRGGYCVLICPELLSPYIHGDASVTSCRWPSTTVVPWLMFQYGMDATTSVCRGALPRKFTIISPTRTAPIRTVASHAAPANVCRGFSGTVAGAWLPPCAVFVVSAVVLVAPVLISPARSQLTAAAATRPASWSSITAWMMSSRLRVARKPTRSAASPQSGTRRCMSS